MPEFPPNRNLLTYLPYQATILCVSLLHPFVLFTQQNLLIVQDFLGLSVSKSVLY